MVPYIYVHLTVTGCSTNVASHTLYQYGPLRICMDTVCSMRWVNMTSCEIQVRRGQPQSSLDSIIYVYIVCNYAMLRGECLIIMNLYKMRVIGSTNYLWVGPVDCRLDYMMLIFIIRRGQPQSNFDNMIYEYMEYNYAMLYDKCFIIMNLCKEVVVGPTSYLWVGLGDCGYDNMVLICVIHSIFNDALHKFNSYICTYRCYLLEPTDAR